MVRIEVPTHRPKAHEVQFGRGSKVARRKTRGRTTGTLRLEFLHSRLINVPGNLKKSRI